MNAKLNTLRAAQIFGLVSAAWVILAALFHLFWKPSRPLWVDQFILIGIVLIVLIGIFLIIAILIGAFLCIPLATLVGMAIAVILSLLFDMPLRKKAKA